MFIILSLHYRSRYYSQRLVNSSILMQSLCPPRRSLLCSCYHIRGGLLLPSPSQRHNVQAQVAQPCATSHFAPRWLSVLFSFCLHEFPVRHTVRSTSELQSFSIPVWKSSIGKHVASTCNVDVARGCSTIVT